MFPARPRLRRSFRLLCLAICGCGCLAPPLAADVRVPLYEVEVPVAEQSAEERRRAAADALLIVLSRVTGLASVPRTPEITAALRAPDRFYSQFVFVAKEGGELALQTTFARKPVLELVTSAGLPVLWSLRPRVVAWIVVEGTDREVLSSGGEHALVEALRARASLRGLPLTLPLMDLDDRLLVTADDVSRRARDSIDAASARYGADLVLIGRATESFSLELGAQLDGEWEAWVDGELLEASFSGASATDAAASGIDLVIDALFARYAVLARELNSYEIAVTGLRSARSYAALMTYLEGLEFIEAIGVSSLETRSITVAVASRASFEQLMMLLTYDGSLTEDAFYRGVGARLMWSAGG